MLELVQRECGQATTGIGQATVTSAQPTEEGGQAATDSGQATEEGGQATTESGQATAEYALVIVAAAAIALALIVWATSTGALASFFDSVVAKVASYV